MGRNTKSDGGCGNEELKRESKGQNEKEVRFAGDRQKKSHCKGPGRRGGTYVEHG